MQDSRQQWLESLDPRVRAEIEAEISDYEDPDNAEYIKGGDDWEPGPDWTIELGIGFSRDELRALSEAVGPGNDAGIFIKELVMERVQALLAERRVAATD